MESIEFYSDFRKYLKDYYAHHKACSRYFSFRSFAKNGGITSPSLLRSVMEGKRNLTETVIPKFAKAMQLTPVESNYFAALVRFNQAQKPQAKQRFLEIMRGFRPKFRERLIPIDEYQYYSSWHNLAIRELACILEWNGNYRTLSQAITPRISAREARHAVETLCGLGYLTKTPEGKYVQTDPSITTGSEVTAVAVREMNRQLGDLGTQAIHRFPPSVRHVSSLTMGISRNSFELIKVEIQEFISRIKRIAAEDALSDQVYNMNVQLFPLSKSCPADKEKITKKD